MPSARAFLPRSWRIYVRCETGSLPRNLPLPRTNCGSLPRPPEPTPTAPVSLRKSSRHETYSERQQQHNVTSGQRQLQHRTGHHRLPKNGHHRPMLLSLPTMSRPAPDQPHPIHRPRTTAQSWASSVLTHRRGSRLQIRSLQLTATSTSGTILTHPTPPRRLAGPPRSFSLAFFCAYGRGKQSANLVALPAAVRKSLAPLGRARPHRTTSTART